MRLLSFVVPGEPRVRVGILSHDGARVVDLTAIGVDDMFEAVARIGDVRRVAAHLLHSAGAIAYSSERVRLVAPLPFARTAWGGVGGGRDPGSGRRQALPLAGHEPAPQPVYVDPELILGPLDTLEAPDGGGFDNELAFGIAGVVSGRSDDALAGLLPVLRWAGRTVMGPWLVTPDELPDGGEVVGPGPAITLAIGGAVRYRGSWADDAFAVRRVYAAVSSFALRAGDVLCAVRLALPPAPGDEVLLTIERLGVLSARVASAATDPAATPAATAE